MDDEKKVPKTKAQKVFVEIIEKENKAYCKTISEALGREEEPIFTEYYFHDDKTVSVDGTVYEVLNYGHLDGGYGRHVHDDIQKALKKIGYYLENYNNIDWTFVKEDE